MPLYASRWRVVVVVAPGFIFCNVRLVLPDEAPAVLEVLTPRELKLIEAYLKAVAKCFCC